jgi:hypothetical protein
MHGYLALLLSIILSVLPAFNQAPVALVALGYNYNTTYNTVRATSFVPSPAPPLLLLNFAL